MSRGEDGSVSRNIAGTKGRNFYRMVISHGLAGLALAIGYYFSPDLFSGLFQYSVKSLKGIGTGAYFLVLATTYNPGHVLKFLKDLKDLFSRIISDLVYYRFEPLEAEEADYEQMMHDLGMSFVISESLDKMDERKISEILGDVRYALAGLKEFYLSIKDQKKVLEQKENLRNLEKILGVLVEQIGEVIKINQDQLIKEEQLINLQKIVENLAVVRSRLSEMTDQDKKLINESYIRAKGILQILSDTIQLT
jgi:hypothetical protein